MNSNFPHVFMGRRPGINNFLRRASRRGNMYSGSLKVKDVGSISYENAAFHCAIRTAHEPIQTVRQI